jgi:hypothetical protein
MSSDQATGGEPPIDPLLGQPRMVNDPRISVTQAAEVLGRLPRRGAPNTSRGLLLSDGLRVRAKGEPIKLAQAAQWLRRPTDAVRQLIAEGKLPLVPGSERLVYPSDVRALPAAPPAPPRNPPPATGPGGYINTRAAAKRLDLSPSQTRQLAADGRLPATRDDQGRWWFNPDHIDMVRRARQAQALAKLVRGEEAPPHPGSASPRPLVSARTAHGSRLAPGDKDR